MALHNNPLLTPPQLAPLSDYDQKRLELGRLIDEGDASGLVDGDIFEIVAKEYGLDLDEGEDQVQ